VLYNRCCERSMVYDLFVGCDKEWYSWQFLDMVKVDDCIYDKLVKICEDQEKFHY